MEIESQRLKGGFILVAFKAGRRRAFPPRRILSPLDFWKVNRDILMMSLKFLENLCLYACRHLICAKA